MSTEDRPGRPHRPAPYADLTEMIDAAGGVEFRRDGDVAAETAQALVRAGRRPGGGSRFVELADRVGLDTLAALWRDADPVSLPGALWALYMLRQWTREDTEDVTRLWRLGEALAPADAVVAGLPDFADPPALRDFADAVLAGVYAGDLDVALERAAAFFRVVAAGRRSRDGEHGVADIADVDAAARNDRVATALATAARRWREGTLG